MREKFGNKVIITLALAALLSELLNVSNELYGATPVLKGIAIIVSIVSVVWLWWYLVITKDRKEKVKKQETTKKLIDSTEFDGIYKELCDKHKVALEKKRVAPRNRLVFRYASLAVLGGSSGVALFYLLCGDPYMVDKLVGIIFFAIVALIISACTSEKTTFEYKAEYKNRIVNSLIKYVNPQLNYSTVIDDEQQVLATYEAANFGLIEANVCECLDKIYGNMGNNYVEMVELKLGNNVTTEDGKSKLVKIFNGYFGILPLGINTEFKLKLSAVGVQTRAEIYEYKTKKIKLDSTEFMDHFVVQTNDKMLATRILTSEVMSELFDYRDKLGITLDIAIKDGMIYFLFYTGDMFEPDIMTDSMNKDIISKDYATIKKILELMQKMSEIVKEVQL